MVILLVIMGALFSLLFGINSILRTARGKEKVSFFETLVAFLALVFPVMALVNNSASTQPLPLVNGATIGLGVALLLMSVITFIIERGKSARPLAQRRSVFGIGLGLLLVAAIFITPLAGRLSSSGQRNLSAPASTPNNGSTVNVAVVGGNAVSSSPTPTLAKPITVVPTHTPDAALLQMSATPTRFPGPTPTPTNTPFIIATSTSGSVMDTNQSAGQAAAAQITGCMAVVRQNVNLRSGPGTSFQLLTTIPFSTTLNVSAKNKTADWWHVSYENQSGWVSGDYVNVDADCATLPIKVS